MVVRANLHSAPLTHANRCAIAQDGLNSQQEWGIVLIVIGMCLTLLRIAARVTLVCWSTGGILVAPPVCVLGVLLGGDRDV